MNNLVSPLVKQLVLLLLALSCTVQVGATTPNVILILTDDQGYGDVSAHGNPVLKTPNLDRLREQSVGFTDFHVAPMCSPTRGQLMTGLDAMRNGCTAVCQGRSMIRSELPTMANFFADSGYATGHFGKWHLGDSYPHRPQDRGFQETLHHRAWGITSLADYWGNSYFDPVLSLNGSDKQYEGYCTDIFFSKTMEWIEKQVAEDKPFFAYLATNTPHVPNVVAEEYAQPYVGAHKDKPIPSKFFGMIANLDKNLGRLEGFLETRRLRENTILIYMTDNGTQSREAQHLFNAGMRAKKTSLYEGGHRVPLYIRWPAGGLAHNTQVDELTQVQDILPTLIDLCALKNETSTTFDGMSLAGLLKDTTTKLPDRKLVIQYRVSGRPWNSAVVLWNKWRLINGEELYHIGHDPGQRRNVAAENVKVLDAMAKHYEAWHAKTKPFFEKRRWITIGSEEANPVVLYAQDWVGDYCDNPRGLSQAKAKGHWDVIVDRAGVYEIELRRWPKESGKTLTEGWEGPKDRGSSARPIAGANLRIAGTNHTIDTRKADTRAVFYLKLPAGETKLETLLTDPDGKSLCSAMYVYVRRVDKDEAGQVELTP